MNKHVHFKILGTLIFHIFILSFYSCQKEYTGGVKDNKAPETYMTVDTIKRAGVLRLNSTINIKWWGTDVDGFIVNYKVTTAQGIFFTKRQDTTLVVNLPEGRDSFDFNFQVQAIDNKGLIDPTPAHLVYPIKNSKPTIAFITNSGSTSGPSRSNPSYMFPVYKFSWNAQDADGPSNLRNIEVVLNDTNAQAISLNPNISTITIEGNNWNGTQTDCKIYQGSNNQLANVTLNKLQLNAYNTLYIRAVDVVNTKSPWVKGNSVYFRSTNFDNLLVNSFSNASTKYSSTEKLYFNYLSAVGITNVDTLRLFEVKGNNYRQISSDNFGQGLIFKHFKSVIWIGNNADNDLNYGQKTLSTAINAGTKVYFSTLFSSSFDSLSSALEFTPIQKTLNIPSNELYSINVDDTLKNLYPNYPLLTAKKIVGNAGVLIPKQGTKLLYSANVLNNAGQYLKGQNIVSLAGLDSKGNANFVFFSGEFDIFETSISAATGFFKAVFVDELKLK